MRYACLINLEREDEQAEEEWDGMESMRRSGYDSDSVCDTEHILE